jgi:hypothetical protein
MSIPEPLKILDSDALRGLPDDSGEKGGKGLESIKLDTIRI